MKYNLNQIEANPNHCFDTMTVLELSNWKSGYYNRIEREAISIQKKYYAAIERERRRIERDTIRKQRELRIQAERQARIDAKRKDYENKVLALYHRIAHLHTFENTNEFIGLHGRSIGNTIHDLPYIWTGYESVGSITLRNSMTDYDPCREHFYPRQWSGETIVRHIIENQGITMDELLSMLDKFRQVHKVTSIENRVLMKYQGSDDFTTPKYSYDQAGIQLQQVKETDVVFDWT